MNDDRTVGMEIRAQILEEATRRFAGRGFAGTSLQEIASAVGIRKPSLLYYFPSKDELRRSVLDEVLARWNDVLPRLLLAAAKETRFDAVMEELTTFFATDPDRARLLVREALDRPEDMTERLTAHLRPWLDVLAAQVEKGKAQGLMHDDVDAEAYVVHVMHMVVSGIALGGVLSCLLGQKGNAAAVQRRHTREMLRLARASLFVEPYAASKPG